MNRRKFLKWLGVGAVAGAVAPAALLKWEPASEAAEEWKTIRCQEPAETGGWVSYRFHYTVSLPPQHSWRLRNIG